MDSEDELGQSEFKFEILFEVAESRNIILPSSQTLTIHDQHYEDKDKGQKKTVS